MGEAAPVRPVIVEEEQPTVAVRERTLLVYFVTIIFMVGVAAIAPVVYAGFDLAGWEKAQLKVSGATYEELKGMLGDVHDDLGALQHHMMHRVDEDVIMLKVLFLNRKVEPRFARKVAKIVHRNARHYRKDPDFILSVIKVESNFNPKARSEYGATGLMQVMPFWKDQLGIVEDLTDPAASVKWGMHILGFYEKMYADLETALSAYNRGPGMVDTDLMRGKDPARNGYAEKVLDVYATLKKLSEAEKES